MSATEIVSSTPSKTAALPNPLAGLPAPLYNDLTAGGYLTWGEAVPGGVFIDGRLEVYDTAFFSEYLAALSNPAAWRKQADALGIQTVVLFHRWANRQSLIHALMPDPEWSLVYHDEVAAVFVRTRGNEKIIALAREIYPAWRERTDERLSGALRPWQSPTVQRCRTANLEHGHSLDALLQQADQGQAQGRRMVQPLT